MKVRRLEAENYRNLERVVLKPVDRVNVIYGENAQGKTNLLEAIWLFTGAKSFRGTKDRDLIRFGRESACLRLKFYGQGREQEAEIRIQEKREASRNGIACSHRENSLAEAVQCILFTPDHLNLIKEGPAQRRLFLDRALSQLSSRYHQVLTDYNRALTQRNHLLKDLYAHPELESLLDVWEEQLASLSGIIAGQRQKYVEKLSPFVAEIFYGLSGGKEIAQIALFHSFETEPSVEEAVRSALRSSRREDQAAGITSTGVHRDDLLFTINGLSARSYGSQGQQRSCALALKLGEASVFEEMTGHRPVALLDDVMSELDRNRQDYILHHLDGWQVFFTCCQPETVRCLRDGASFRMEQGRLMEG